MRQLDILACDCHRPRSGSMVRSTTPWEGQSRDQLQRVVDVTRLERLTASRAVPAGWQAVDVDGVDRNHRDAGGFADRESGSLMNARNRRPFSDVRGANTPCGVIIVVSGIEASPVRSRSEAA